jgi:SpoVK/Ycf46/Vps4 family AAA+-type ATPase
MNGREPWDFFMSKQTRKNVHCLVKEHGQKALLSGEGLTPRSRILIHGPVGSGKTMLAKSLCKSIGGQVFVFENLPSFQRGARSDYRFENTIMLIGELHKWFGIDSDTNDSTAFTLPLEHALDRATLIATSCKPDGVDKNVLSKFDAFIELSNPDLEEINHWLKNLRTLFGIEYSEPEDLGWDDGVLFDRGLKWCDVHKISLDVHRKVTLLDKSPADIIDEVVMEFVQRSF